MVEGNLQHEYRSNTLKFPATFEPHKSYEKDFYTPKNVNETLKTYFHEQMIVNSKHS